MAVILGRKAGGSGGGGGAPSGPAGGDLGGTYPDPTLSVAKQAELDGKIPKSIVDAKGDMILGTASDTVARLAAGLNGQVPVYQSGQTTGILPSYPPGYEVAVATPVTSDVGPITETVEANSVTIITLGAVTYTAVPHIIEFWFSSFASLGAAQAVIFSLFDDTTQVYRVWQENTIAAGQHPGFTLRTRITPTAASHTYRIAAFRPAGGTSFTIEGGTSGAGAFAPIQMRATIA